MNLMDEMKRTDAELKELEQKINDILRMRLDDDDESVIENTQKE